MNSWKAFSASCWFGKCFPYKKLSWCLVVRWMWWMRQNFLAQFIHLLKHWLCNVRSGIVVKNWALSVGQCQLQALQFLVHLIDLLSILLRCNGFTGIQKAVVYQTGSRWPNSDHDIFFRCKFGFGKCFGASSQSKHWTGCPWLLYKIHFSSHVKIQLGNGSFLLHRIREDDTSKWFFFYFSVSSWGTHISSFLIFPMLNDRRMIDIEYCATSHVAVRGSSLMILSTGLCQLPMAACYTSTSRLSSLLQNFLVHCCTACLLAVPRPEALLILCIVSPALRPILNLNFLKIAQKFFCLASFL